jgi:hypothetical protein
VAYALTYSLLVSSIQSYNENSSDKFAAQIPQFISNGENRVAADMKQQGFQSVVAGTFVAGVNGAVVSKPAFWRETISFNYKDPVLGWQPIRIRALEYLKNFWPLQGSTSPPRFYADYNFENFLVAPSPDQAYAFELAYYARLEPLDATNQTNWLTFNAPQVLLYACLLEAALWLKNSELIALFQGQYNDQKSSILQENAERLGDRNEAVAR